jgi:hypothetical protein
MKLRGLRKECKRDVIHRKYIYVTVKRWEKVCLTYRQTDLSYAKIKYNSYRRKKRKLEECYLQKLFEKDMQQN